MKTMKLLFWVLDGYFTNHTYQEGSIMSGKYHLSKDETVHLFGAIDLSMEGRWHEYYAISAEAGWIKLGMF